MKRFEGKNLEEALENASRALNVERYRLSYHVVMEKRGFLGGMKRVVVEADINDAAAPPPPPPAGLDDDDSVQPPSLSYESELGIPSRDRDRGPRRGGRGRRGGGGGGGGGGRSGGRREEKSRSTPMQRREPPAREDSVVETIPEQGTESDKAGQVREWFEELFDLADLDLVVRTQESDEQLEVRLFGGDSKRLLAHGGELLDSLQVLVNKSLAGRGAEKPVEVDCREFKGRRSSDLERRARAVADEVRSSGREQILEAMSPIERRIVHLALQDDGEVMTESRGEGFYKRIAIVLRTPGTTPRRDIES